jgi:hypothetical protein
VSTCHSALAPYVALRCVRAAHVRARERSTQVTGGCDVAEFCNGPALTCPPDVVMPLNTLWYAECVRVVWSYARVHAVMRLMIPVTHRCTAMVRSYGMRLHDCVRRRAGELSA